MWGKLAVLFGVALAYAAVFLAAALFVRKIDRGDPGWGGRSSEEGR